MPSAEDIYLFRHAAYRDVAYGLQLPSDRAELHALALEIMQQVFHQDLDAFAIELATHARQAREQGADGADNLAGLEARFVVTAVGRALQRAQWDMVVLLCGYGLACPALESGQVLKLLSERSAALRELGRNAEALESYLELARMARDSADERNQIHGLVDAASILLMRGEVERGHALLDQAQALAEAQAATGRPAQLALVLLTRSNASTSYEEVETLLTRALEVLADTEDAPIRFAVRGSIANMYGSTGRHDEALAELRSLVGEFERLEQKRNVSVSWANIGRQLLLKQRDAEAEEALGRSIDCAAEIGNARTEAFARANLATLQIRRGAFEPARVNIDRAITIAQDYELTTFHAAYLCTRAELELLSGHERDAQQIVEDARAQFIAAHAEAFVPEYCGIIRLRIAASLAVSSTGVDRATSELTAAPPDARWLPVMRAIQTELARTHADKGKRGGILLELASSAGAAVLSEIEDAVQRQRPALVFRGYLPSEMSPALRKELNRRIGSGERAALQSLHPELLRAIQA